MISIHLLASIVETVQSFVGVSPILILRCFVAAVVIRNPRQVAAVSLRFCLVPGVLFLAVSSID